MIGGDDILHCSELIPSLILLNLQPFFRRIRISLPLVIRDIAARFAPSIKFFHSAGCVLKQRATFDGMETLSQNGLRRVIKVRW